MPFTFSVAALLPSACPHFVSSRSGTTCLLANAPQHTVHLFYVLFLCSLSLDANACLTEVSPLCLMTQRGDLEKGPQVTPKTHLFMPHAKAQGMNHSDYL